MSDVGQAFRPAMFARAKVLAYGLKRGVSLSAVGPVLLAGILVEPGLARLEPATDKAWATYVSATEARRARELDDPRRFLAMDFGGADPGSRDALRAGRVVTQAVETRQSNGKEIDIPDGKVHHWRGAIFIPNATVAEVMATLAESPPKQADVLKSRVLERGTGWMNVYLRLRRSKIITVVYDTEHSVRFTTYSSSRAASTTMATRIVEVESAGTSEERIKTPGDDHGFLKRLNAYWRYEAVPGGVIAECESVSLSRGIPFGLGTILGPIVEGTARDAMESALVAVREAVSQRPRVSSPAR